VHWSGFLWSGKRQPCWCIPTGLFVFPDDVSQPRPCEHDFAKTVSLILRLPAAVYDKLAVVLERFEGYCIVSQSLAAGIPILVNVYDADE
jgi:hypothetical protein